MITKEINNQHNVFRGQIEKLLEGSNIAFNGDNPWDIRVYNSNLYERVRLYGILGLGEAYMDNWWDSVQLDELFRRFCAAKITRRVKFDPHVLKDKLWSTISNRQSKRFAPQLIRHHYDIGNDLYRAMLDKRLTYSCGYWKNAKTLDDAQEHKFDLICRKLNLQPGQRILDIGCGWGGFVQYAAENYGVSCVGITLSEQQSTFARSACQGLPVDIRLMDYRELTETFDHIVSIGMFEHVGFRNYDAYMRMVQRCLNDDGLFLLHTIGGNTSTVTTDPWFGKYIFPGGMLPSINQIAKAIEGRFVMEDWHNFGVDYDKTLMCWYQNFSNNWEAIKDRYGERFYRMWKYYLLSCAGAFRARENQLWQIVLSKNGVQGGYGSVR